MNTILEKHLQSADEAINCLIEGNKRFVQNLRINRNFYEEIEQTKEKQKPFAVIVSCMDSRTSTEIIFDQGLGDVFSIRIAGNVITPEIIGSVEYACAAVGSKAVVVLGHTGCGAIKGAMDDVQLGHLPSITSKIKKCISHDSSVKEVTSRNVLEGIKILQEDSKILNELSTKNEIKIIGGIYDIETGLVSFMD